MAKIPGKQAKGQRGNSSMQLHAQEPDTFEKRDGDSVPVGVVAWVDATVQPTLSVRHTKTLKERILQVLLTQSGLFVHVIAKRADATVDDTSKVLRELERANGVFKRKEGKGSYYQYYLLEGYFEPPTPVELRVPRTAETLHRLTLLKRMRERLICDHWYLLDAVIKDYEITLKESDYGE